MAFGINAVSSPQRGMTFLALRKTGGGTPVLSGLCASFCTVVDNGVGDYTINVNIQQPFAQNIISNVLLHTAGIAVLDLANSDNLKIRVKTFAVDGTTPAEKDFDLICVGSTASTLLG